MVDAPREHLSVYSHLDEKLHHIVAKLGCGPKTSLRVADQLSCFRCIFFCMLGGYISDFPQSVAKCSASVGESASYPVNSFIHPHNQGASFIIGHMISFAKEPAGVLWRAWLDETRYDGMLKVIGFWHEEELLVIRYRVAKRAALDC